VQNTVKGYEGYPISIGAHGVSRTAAFPHRGDGDDVTIQEDESENQAASPFIIIITSSSKRR
jgi:hypothetical protein